MELLLLITAFFIALFALVCEGGPKVKRWKP